MLDLNIDSSVTASTLPKKLTDPFVKPATFLKAADRALTEMQTQTIASYVENAQLSESNETGTTNRPQLAPPVRSVAEKIAEGENNSSVFALLAQLMDILNDTSIEGLKSKLEVYKQFAASRQNSLERTSEKLRELAKNLEQAKLGFDKAKSDLVNADEGLTNVENRVSNAETALAKAVAKYQKAKNDFAVNPTAETAQAVAIAKAEAELKQEQLEQVKQEQPEALALALRNKNLAQEALITAGENVLRASEAFDGEFEKLPAPTEHTANDLVIMGVISRVYQATNALITQYLTELQEIIRKTNETSSGDRMQMFRKLQEQLQRKLEAQSREFEISSQQARDRNEERERNAKIFGGVGVVFSILLAPFMAVIAIPAAIIGAAWYLADLILDDLGLPTPTKLIINPITDNTIGWAVKELSQAIYNSLDPNLDEHTRTIISSTIAGVVVALGTIALAGAVGAAATLCLTKLAANPGWLGRIASAIVTPGETAIAKALASRGISPSLVSAAGNTVSGATGLAGTILEGQMGLESAKFQKKAMDSIADVAEERAVLTRIQEIISAMIEEMTRSMKGIQTFLPQTASEILMDDRKTLLTVLRKSSIAT